MRRFFAPFCEPLLRCGKKFGGMRKSANKRGTARYFDAITECRFICFVQAARFMMDDSVIRGFLKNFDFLTLFEHVMYMRI